MTAWLDTLRDEARQAFETEGWPTTRLEAWRNTQVKALTSVDWRPADGQATGALAARIAAVALGDVAARLVLVNGRFVPELSRTDDLPAKITVGPLSEHLDRVEGQLGRVAPAKGNPFVAWNTGMFRDGALVHVAAGAVIDKPIEIVVATTAGQAPSVGHARVIVRADRHSQVTLVERTVDTSEGDTSEGDTSEGDDAAATLTNAVTEVAVGEDAIVRHIKVQSEARQACHVAYVGASLQRGGRFDSFVLSNGARVGRAEVQVTFAGEGGQTDLRGLYVGQGDQNLDHVTVVEHAVPRCESRETYKGVLGDKAVGSFQGTVLIREGATRSVAHQLSRTLLLSRDAIANTKPQLEIDNDDVTASHGATIGQLAEDAVFYLRSRGLDERTSRALLTYAFTREILDAIPVPELAEAQRRIALARLGEDLPHEEA